MISVNAGVRVIDNCGTGGDSSGTFNISTTASFVMAGAGAHVAKHGNRAISSSSGAADVLEALGVRVTATPQEAARLIEDVGIAFLFAPAFHPAMKHVQPVRRDLKIRTVFNLLGPLANPARARTQLIGTPSSHTAELMASALHELGTTRSFVVHGHGGLDEVSTTGPTEVYEITSEGVVKHIWQPSDFAVPRADLESLQGGDAARNAAIFLEILDGRPGPKRDIVLANAAAGLVAAGLAPNLLEGVEAAARSIDTGAAMAKFNLLRKGHPV
jgi:anthranilate phosphoribosyltransferase